MSTKILEKKKKKVKEIKEKIESASVLVVTDYCGLTVKGITELRKDLRADESEFKIFKNTLVQRAADDAGMSDLKGYLSGPTALLIGYKDAVTPLKTLVKFIKENEKGEIRAGIVEKSFVKKEQLLEISKLPTREVLLTKVLCGLQSPLYGLVNVLQGSIRNLVYALDAIKNKKGGEQK